MANALVRSDLVTSTDAGGTGDGPLLTAAKVTNMAVAFGCELGVLAAAAYWGWTTDLGGTGGAVRWVRAIGTPVAFGAAWTVFGAPGAAVDLGSGGKLVFQLAWMLGGAGLLAASGHPRLGAALGVLGVASTVLGRIWNQ